MTTSELLQASGTIFCDGAIRGSGAHIYHPSAKRSIIVTAAHVLYDSRAEKAFIKCWYRANNARFTALPFAQVSGQINTVDHQDAVQRSENDLVFVALSRKLSSPQIHLSTTPIVFSKGPKATSLNLVGYHAATERMQIATHCKTLATPYFYNQKLVLHNCPTGPGASGGPLIDLHTQTLVAVHGGTLLIEHRAGGKTQPWTELQIHQGRAIDRQVHTQLDDFIAQLP